MQSTNKIIPKPLIRTTFWTARLDVYDPRDKGSDCLCGFRERHKVALCPVCIPDEDLLFSKLYSPMFGDLKSGYRLNDQLGNAEEDLRDNSVEKDLCDDFDGWILESYLLGTHF